MIDEKIKTAAYDYSQCQHPETFTEQKRHVKGFLSGANWAMNQIKWLDVKDVRPANDQYCFFKGKVTDDIYCGNYIGYQNEGLNFKNNQGYFWSYTWCPIPESLLKPVGVAKDETPK